MGGVPYGRREKVKVSLDNERLIKELDLAIPKLDFSSIASKDFKLNKKELYFRLGQRALVDMLLEALNNNKKGEY
jgi:hypothetical protein